MDSYLLTLGGTTVDIGSWTRADPGVDWGTHDLLKAVYAENARAEGGRIAFETAGVRRLGFPLLLPSGGAGLTLAGLESLLSLLARPGACLDVKPDGATTNAVRFDVLTGRWEPDPNIRHWEIGVRLGTLKLDTQPFAYLPSWTVLASAASIGLPGRLTLPGGSIGGDIPALLAISVQPTNQVGTEIGGLTFWNDMVAWSVAGRPSFYSFFAGGSWKSEPTTILVGAGAGGAKSADVIEGTQTLRWSQPSAVSGYTQIAYYDIPTTVEPAYRGRHRVLLYARQHQDLASPITHTLRLSVDAVSMVAVQGASEPMASTSAIATLPVMRASVFAPNVLDLGEITLPPAGSGAIQPLRLRLWSHRPTNTAIGNTFAYLAGVQLVPVDGPNGIQVAGLGYPEQSIVAQGGFTIDAYAETVTRGLVPASIASMPPVADLVRFYRGRMPKAAGTVALLDLAAGVRQGGVGASDSLFRTQPAHAAVTVLARPRFTFLKGEI